MKKTLSILLISAFLVSCSNQVTGVSSTGNTTTSTQNKDIKVKNISVGKTPHGIGYAQGFVFNSNIADNTISVIDAKTDSVVKTITIEGGTPGYIKAFHDGKNILFTDTKQNKINILDPMQDHKIISSINVSSTPDKIVISEDDSKAFISLPTEAKIIQLNITDRTKIPELKVIDAGNMLPKEEHRSIDLKKGWIITPNTADNNVSLINTDKGINKTLKDGNSPATVNIGLINDEAKVAIVGNKASNTVTIFDLDSDGKTTINDVGNSPTDSLVIPELKRVFITMSGSNEVAVIDYENKKLVGKVSTGKRPVHIYLAPELQDSTMSVKHEEGVSSNQIWVGNDDGASVTVFDASTLKVISTIATGEGHHKMSFSGDKAYVSNIKANNVSVIERKQLKD